MKDPQPGCAVVSSAVEHMLRTAGSASLPPEFLFHLSTCPQCRAGLLLTLQALAASAGPPAQLDACASCQAELAAFIEQERRDPARAAELYPAVWSHLWLCRACLEEYLMVQELLDAEASASIAAAPRPLRQPSRPGLPLLRLTRPMLIRALPARAVAQVAYRGGERHSFILFDASQGEPPRQLTTEVYPEDANHWTLQMTAQPAVAGWLLLTAGARSFSAPFSSQGVATISAIPAELLIAPDAPDLEFALIPAEAET